MYRTIKPKEQEGVKTRDEAFESRSLLESSVEEGFKTREEYYDNLGKKFEEDRNKIRNGVFFWNLSLSLDNI